MSSENWTISRNLCRCCHAQGDFKSLVEPWTVNGQELIYADLLKEYFDINLSPVPGVLCVLTYTICKACIGKLCDAVKFKKDVEACEKKFQELYNNNVITVENADIDISVKEELPDSCIEDDYSLPDETPDYEFDEEVDNEQPQETQAEVKLESQVKEESDECPDPASEDCESDVISDHDPVLQADWVHGESALIARFKNLEPLPTRATLRDICPEYCRQLGLLNGIKVHPQAIKKLLDDHEFVGKRRKAGRKFTTEKLAHIANASIVTECSNDTPFRSKSRQGFPCLYCKNIFENIDKLRSHSAQHKKLEIIKVLKTCRRLKGKTN